MFSSISKLEMAKTSKLVPKYNLPSESNRLSNFLYDIDSFEIAIIASLVMDVREKIRPNAVNVSHVQV